jgi:hypothetical protein
MREQEVRELYEAYLQVHQPQEEVEQLDEGRTTSLSALSRESEKRKADKKRGRPETESEIHSRLMMGKFRPGASQEERAEGGRQVLKDRGKVPKKGGKDMFEHILEHLVAEGYADTNESALVIMANMSEEWRQSIVEQSAIGARAAKVVDDQRQGYHGDSDAINKLQDAASRSMGRLKKGQGPVVTPGLPGV